MSLAPGRIVIVKGIRSNGTDEHPAIVTRVWSESCCNCTVFLDAQPPKPYCSIKLYKSREEADAALNNSSGTDVVAFWPERK
jgi:hypothetical protein